MSANSAASAQGSRFNRAKAEMTVSGISFRSSQTVANRNGLNAAFRLETEGVAIAQFLTELATKGVASGERV